jgi:hypothetical protein
LSGHEADDCQKQPAAAVLHTNHAAGAMKAKQFNFLEIRSCYDRAPARTFDIETRIVDPSATFLDAGL